MKQMEDAKHSSFMHLSSLFTSMSLVVLCEEPADRSSLLVNAVEYIFLLFIVITREKEVSSE